MKRFIEENGKEIVFVQGKDLRFLDAQARTPKNIKKLITFEHIDMNNQEVEFEFDNKEFVKFIKDSDFILKKDEFENITFDSAYTKIMDVENQINKKRIEMDNDLKNKLDVTKKRHDLAELYHKEQSILYFLDHQMAQKKTK